MRNFLPLLLTFAFSAEFHWEAITSLINPTDIQFFDDGNIYATTNGGVIKFDINSQSFTEIGFNEGLWPIDFTSILMEGNILYVTDVNGGLQIYNLDSGSLYKITHLDFIEGITDLNSTENFIFSIGQGNTQDGLLQFSLENGDVYYQNYFQNFPLAFSQIYDIHIVDDSNLYIGVDSDTSNNLILNHNMIFCSGTEL